MNDLEKKSIECIKNMPIEETTYQVARNVVLDCINKLEEENDNLKNIISSVKEDFLNANNELTNLQQELEIMVKDDERSQETIIKLSKENERLKELDENYPIEEELAEAYRREEDYKTRIEKAVEYIKSHQKVFALGVNEEVDEFDYISTSPKALLNILNGDKSE